jgi:hypothetical protein
MASRKMPFQPGNREKRFLMANVTRTVTDQRIGTRSIFRL